MKISLITINRNNANGLSRTLASIAGQLRHLPQDVELEHIVVDGQSTDDSTSRLIPELASTLIIAPPEGVYNAINVGMKVSTGDIIGLLHSGDIFKISNALAMIATRFEGKDNPDYIWGDVNIGHRFYSGKDYSLENLLCGYAPPHPSLYISRKTLTEVGLYNETYRVAADFDYFVRIIMHPDLHGAYLPGALVEMESGGMSAKLRNRLWTNNTERLRSLRACGLPASRWRLMAHYHKKISGYIWYKRN